MLLLPFTVISSITATAIAGVLPPAGHPWIPPLPGDVRSPCPGLNTLANHGYLPRNGKNIQQEDFISATNTVFNFSTDVGAFFAKLAVECCGNTNGGVDLNALAKHNALEHDTSLVHADAAPNATFAPTTPDPLLLVDLLSRSPLGIDINTLAQTRLDRLQTYGKPFPEAQEKAADLEAALVWFAMKDPKTGLAPIEKVGTWLGDEMLPVGFEVPTEGLTFDKIPYLVGLVEKAMQDLRGV